MRRAAPLAGLAAVLLSGCVSILPDPPPPPRIFALRVAVEPAAQPIAPERIVAVAQPELPSTLASGDILWIANGAIAYMDAAQWTSRTPALLQAAVIEAIDGQNLVRAGIQAASGARSDVEVRWDVRDFQIEEAGPRLEAVFSAEVKVLESGGRRVLASTPVTARARLGDRSATAAAAALQTVASQAAGQIAAFAAQEAARLDAALAQPSAASTSR